MGTAETIDAIGEPADGYVVGPPVDPRRYRIDAADIGNAATGGEGLVFRALDERDGRAVALKMLTAVPADEFDLRIERAQALVDARHPGLMRHLETFVGPALAPESDASDLADDADVLYSVSEWIDGSPLPDVTGDASTVTKLAWVAEVAEAVAALHRRSGDETSAGLVHRDIKPSNVRITDDGRAVLIDYGISRAVDDDLTRGVGTYRWRAPEVVGAVAARPGAASDVWGIGAVAHWLLVGEPPLLDGAEASRRRIAAADATRELGDPDAVALVIAELLESSPDDRPSDLDAWAFRLRRAASRRHRRRRIVTTGRAIAAVLVVAVAVVIAAWVWPRESADTADPDATPERPMTVLAFDGDRSQLRRMKRPGFDPKVHALNRSDGTYAAILRPGDTAVAPSGPLLASANGLEIFAASGAAPPGIGLTLVDRSGSRWAVSIVPPLTIDAPITFLTAEQVRVDAEELVAHLRIDGGRVTADGPVEESFPFLGQPVAWMLTDGSFQMNAYRDRTTAVEDVGGTPVRVRGRDAVLRKWDLVWRENADLIVHVFPRGDSSPDALVGVAGRLVTITAEELERLPFVDDGAATRVVLRPTTGDDGFEAAVRFLDADGNLLDVGSVQVSPDGWPLEFPDGAVSAQIFAGGDDRIRPPPPCASTIPAPSDDVPRAVAYTVDPACRQ